MRFSGFTEYKAHPLHLIGIEKIILSEIERLEIDSESNEKDPWHAKIKKYKDHLETIIFENECRIQKAKKNIGLTPAFKNYLKNK